MPLAAATVAAAVVKGASSVYSASQSNKAASKANAAQQAAAAQQLAVQTQTRDMIFDANKPALNVLSPAIQALMTEFGITPSGARTSTRPPAPPMTYDRAGNIVPAGAPAAAPAPAPANNVAAAKATGGPAGTSPLEPAPAPPAPDPLPQAAPAAAPTMTGGQPDFAAYGAANPDLQAEWQRIQQTGNADGFGNDPNAYYQWHYGKYGQSEGRELPTSGGQPAPAPAPAQPDAAPAINEPDQPGMPGRPSAAAAPEFDRSGVKMGEYGSAPDLNSFFTNFEVDPGYQHRLNEGLRGVNAASAVRGKLRSGDAAKALQSRGEGLAAQEYGNWFDRQMSKYQAANQAFQGNRAFAGNMFDRQNQNFNSDRAFGMGQYEYGVNRGDRNFETDRGYGDSRQDNDVNNLFRLTGVGLTGAGNVAGAGTNYANAATNIYGNQADAASQSAYAKANANSGLVGDIAGTAANLFTKWGGGGGSGGISPAASFDQAGFNSWAKGSW